MELAQHRPRHNAAYLRSAVPALGTELARREDLPAWMLEQLAVMAAHFRSTQAELRRTNYVQ